MSDNPRAKSWRVTIRVNNYVDARAAHRALRNLGIPFRVLRFEALTADGEPVIRPPDEDEK